MDKRYSKGNIKIKNSLNKMDTFYPLTDISGVTDEKNFLPLNESIDKKIEHYTEIYNKGGIEIIYTPNIDEKKYAKNTLFALLNADVFDYTVDVTSSTNFKSAIPFNLYDNADIILEVDWGDGTTSSLTSDTYTSYENSIHTYLQAGLYNIKVISSNWEKISYYTLYDGSYSTSYDKTYYLGLYNKTLKSINKKIPLFADIKAYSYYAASSPTKYSGCAYMFYYCSKLLNICSNIFENYKNVTDFKYCFAYCTSLTAIPDHLFDSCSDATNFSNCFYNCTSLTTLPNDLFKYNTNVTNFSGCFSYCTALTSIPEDLFMYNTLVTNFAGCFSYCTALRIIPQNLFRYNTAVTSFSNCFYRTTNNTFTFTLYIGSANVTNVSKFVYYNSSYQSSRKVYALSGSTTYSNFYSVRNSLYISVYTY